MCSDLKGFLLFVSFLVSLNCYAEPAPYAYLPGCEPKLVGDGDIRGDRAGEILIHDLETGKLPTHDVLFDIEKYEIRNPEQIIEIAKLLARTNQDVSQYIHEFGIQDQKALTEIALISTHIASREVAVYFSNYGITDVNDRIQVTQNVIALAPEEFLKYVDNFKIQDPKTLVELGKKTMKSLPQHSSSDITQIIHKFKIDEQKDLIELAEIENQREISNLSVHLPLYGIQDQSTLIQFAKQQALKYPNYVAQSLSKYKIQDQKNIIEIIKILAKESCWAVADKIQDFVPLEQKDLIEIAKLAAAESGTCIAQHIPRFRIQAEKDRIEIAKIAATVTSEYQGLSQHIQNFEIEDQTALVEIAKSVAQSNSQDLAKNLGHYPILNKDALVEIAKIAAPKAGIQVLNIIINKIIPPSEYANLISLATSESWIVQANEFHRNTIYSLLPLKHNLEEDFTWLAPAIAHDTELLKFFCKTFSIPYNEHQPKAHLTGTLKQLGLDQFISLLTDQSEHAEVQTQLFNGALNIHYGRDPALKARLAKNPTSLQLLEILLGLPEQSLARWSRFSNDRKNSMYELALNISEQRPKIFAEFPNLIPFLIKKDSLYATNLIRDILAFDSKADLSAAFSQTDEILFIENLRVQFEENLRVAFSDPGLSLNYDDFLKLKERWGDLAPVFTLLARFYGNKNWNNEIPWLGRIFSAELKDQFKELKFQKGFDGSDQSKLNQQIDFLTEEQKVAWQKHRKRALVVKDTNVNVQSMRATAKRNFFNAVTTNFLPLLRGETSSVKNEQQILREALHKPGDPRQLFQELRGQYPTAEILYNLQRAFEQAQEPEDVKIELQFLNSNVHDLFPAIVRTQAERDLKEMLSYFKAQATGKMGPTIVYTTLVQDAKNLLTIGDLVEASSCQNYKTGNMIQTLLGYVLDANVQAILSYGLSTGNFKNEKEFDRAIQAVEADPTSIQFHPNTQKFTVTTSDGVIESYPVPKAYYRKILKLGKTDGGAPGLRLERAYQQNHAALAKMERETDLLKQEIQTALGAKQGKINISKSRNPGGVYSDASGGVKTDSYTIQ